ncbi:MAG: sugar phosphate isomerase/epimerase [Clostridia bacterium]|nr:sugar phosphate isomerase/epimerase [Clostridia bacterium]MBR4050076.1 sugar phosphate isomerase/epimerase [Clostridia bacterium]MBR6635132.1 sugar phosphate isomerase/epimerase [Clostridia bacterium]
MKIAVQLYSVRDCINNAEDFFKVLEEIKAMGYEGVEFAGFHGVDAASLKAKLDELGLVPVGAHMGIGDYLPEKIEETVAYHKTLGTLYTGVGGAAHDTVEECEYAAKALAYGAEKLGIPTYYHNHTEEFTPLENGKIGMEIFAEHTKLEVDTYWSHCAGIDNYKYITENKDDICLLHVKDGLDRKPLSLGDGDCDVAAVVKAAKDAGIEWLVVENDDPVPNGIEDVKRSINYLKTLI